MIRTNFQNIGKSSWLKACKKTKAGTYNSKGLGNWKTIKTSTVVWEVWWILLIQIQLIELLPDRCLICYDRKVTAINSFLFLHKLSPFISTLTKSRFHIPSIFFHSMIEFWFLLLLTLLITTRTVKSWLKFKSKRIPAQASMWACQRIIESNPRSNKNQYFDVNLTVPRDWFWL